MVIRKMIVNIIRIMMLMIILIVMDRDGYSCKRAASTVTSEQKLKSQARHRPRPHWKEFTDFFQKTGHEENMPINNANYIVFEYFVLLCGSFPLGSSCDAGSHTVPLIFNHLSTANGNPVSNVQPENHRCIVSPAQDRKNNLQFVSSLVWFQFSTFVGVAKIEVNIYKYYHKTIYI